MRYSCKFIETSAAINDKVDDLLAGILKQIRLHLTTQAHSKQNNSTRAEYKHKKKLSFISIFKSNKKKVVKVRYTKLIIHSSKFISI